MLPRMYCSVKFFEPTVIVGLEPAPEIFWICSPEAACEPPPPPPSSSSFPHAASPSANRSADRIASGRRSAGAQVERRSAEHRSLVDLFDLMVLPLPSFVGWAGGAFAVPLPPI